jgi:hypothetical protein
VADIYDVDPYAQMSFVYQPSNRMDAVNNKDFNSAYVGISGRREIGRKLTFLHEDGKPYAFHPAYLTLEVNCEGWMSVEFRPFVYYVDKKSKLAFAKLVKENLKLLEPIFSHWHIAYGHASEFRSLIECLEDPEEWNWFYSARYRLPVSWSNDLLWYFILVFVILYPLVDAVVAMGEGRKPRLTKMLKAFMDYWQEDDAEDFEDEDPDDETAPPNDIIEIPELESYKFVRTGTWWSILARDNWTCCSCGRSSRKDGVTLEVDHIQPRSLGGTDDPSNLQTLCRKCNIGKSNRDNTDLRKR